MNIEKEVRSLLAIAGITCTEYEIEQIYHSKYYRDICILLIVNRKYTVQGILNVIEVLEDLMYRVDGKSINVQLIPLLIGS